jgi:large subunit ribosomal protein L22
MSDSQSPRGGAAQKARPAREPGSKPVRKERPPRKITTGYRASVPFQRLSATKIRRVADHVRRKPYVEAIALLDVLPHKGARLLRKLIQSAAANALAQNKNLDEQMLYVKELLVDVGPTMKRMWARGRGRADRLLKRSCHLSVVVDEIGGGEKASAGATGKPAKKAASSKGAADASKEGVSNGSEG